MNQTVRITCFFRNNINDDISKQLSNTVIDNDTITVRLVSNSIGDDGTKDRVTTQINNTSAHTLDLRCNDIVGGDALALTNMLRKTKTRTDINL